MRSRGLGPAAAALASVAFAACGLGGAITPGGQGRGDAGTQAGLDGPALPAPDGGTTGPTGTAGADAAACAAESTTAQQLPLDIFIMLDQSGSMAEPVAGGQTKWQAVTSALAQFASQPSLAGVSAGLQFFGLPDAAGNTSCNAVDYATPAVEIAALPGVASAMAAAVAQHGPATRMSTPTSAALQGAIGHADNWAFNHPGHVAIVILATDGEPTECDTNLAHIDALAAAGVSFTPKILTFVIGVGSSLSNLNGIAQAGGTGHAYMVDTSGNVGQQFLDALNAIRGAALGCTYQIPSPDGGTADYSKLNVQYTPGSGGGAEVIPQVVDQAHCPASGDAWYYDQPTAPSQILLCPATCSRVAADSSGTVDILLGCQTATIG